jgi:ubiquitin-activating enzyme E1
MGAYMRGGRLTQVKKPVKLEFRSLAASTAEPGALCFTDGTKLGRAEQLHVALRALWAFEAEAGVQGVGSPAALEQVLAKARALDPQADVDVVAKLAKGSRWELQPLCAFFGGVLAQEVIKMTGKFSPLQQWLHLDSFEVLDPTADSFSAKHVRFADTWCGRRKD